MNEQEFNKIFDKVGKSDLKISLKTISGILASIVVASNKDSETTKKLAEIMSGYNTEEIISKTIMTTCNSIIISLWKQFENQFKEPISTGVGEEAKQDP